MTESNVLTDYTHLETSNNSFEEESEHNVTDYLLPKEHVPGSDLISKVVLTDTRIINIISKSLVNASEDQYTAAQNEFLNKCACDVLYLPKAIDSEYPPIIIEVQKDVNENYMCRAVKYSILVYEKYEKHPVVLIVGVSSVTASINNILAPATSHPFSKEIPSLFWAKRCLLVSSTTLSTIQSTGQLDPLAAIGLFLCSQKPSITQLVSGGQDTTMKLLYKIAVNNVQQLLGEEEEITKGIKAICDNTCVQLEKIKSCIQNGNTESLDKVLLYIEDASVYLNRQKRKFTTGRDVTPIPETPGLKYLENKNIRPKKHNEAHYNELKEYVEQFRNERSGRMSWKKCFLKGYKDNIDAIKQYTTSESLRSQYNKHFK
ncbi:hypothetical protein G6F16_004842 [Rhizopus arrhizus]|uniref:Uncharacterized protein n=1 Tax=Rhizopus oryzae TaxID=64495 RepID=A0A9P6XEJ2_RHIOR|nr:hypothetical protein G6F23_000847 [Rhizopus arrhizus]KAG0765918.1 hypothetical protein G6F24_004024 [Rhizopus arrhizus]KAG0792703.1 hypothetical protein G6F21_004157 [Rhizopus arrhizus]KAG0802350.1 hypothetical protein G6F22_000341 [Rhizopus arrhizus]KAG0819465.1 hypothetical protein G6F20_000741 [Rhizopus arrhizus]